MDDDGELGSDGAAVWAPKKALSLAVDPLPARMGMRCSPKKRLHLSFERESRA
ncbi:expressed protein [Batrachochytrium dendrobatidis JAM81]|uniref:Expressed protein n=1 Tax=Batrachochytrium dendrobatidis (strain JAM81 / FGSC 10211) TaxID=684364 RepID=F4NT79_BATDJ|nr:uncharacterized protein BATDEDRAFT_36524 [Batrachochytrium dendrobatidis JAM81]EGF84299.1 expressed protein [Batrachochytrium dendrobatidis JAM81]|eukprot:XP_006675891.1 expressed protein [Batrachochytrium dendrobatidis JAM81]